MQFGITLPPFGAWSDLHRLTQLAVDAENAGWEYNHYHPRKTTF